MPVNVGNCARHPLRTLVANADPDSAMAQKHPHLINTHGPQHVPRGGDLWADPRVPGRVPGKERHAAKGCPAGAPGQPTRSRACAR